jgi:hypothetical protein
MEQVFTNIYECSIWGDNHNDEYKGSSGDGSNVDYNKFTYVPFLKSFIREKNIQSVVDLGCGDFRCGPLIYDNLNVSYTGYDAYSKVIDHNSKTHSTKKYNFAHLDFFNRKEEIVAGDLCILKDVIQHWGLTDIYSFLDYLTETKKFKYILITNCCHQRQDNTDIQTGDWRPLGCDFFPLKKYNAQKLFQYVTKEVSVIECSANDNVINLSI